MKFTFLIGNGFDIGLGMKTRYLDMYEEYIKSVSKNDCIRRFKVHLRNDKPKYENWSDFEMGMANYALSLENEDELIDCVRDFRSHMVKHLKEQDALLVDRIIAMEESIIRKCAEEMKRSVTEFYMGQSQNVIIELTENIRNSGGRIYNFISFNYTNAFDVFHTYYKRFLNANAGNIIHVHGQLDADVVLGIDNEKQIYKVTYPISRKLKRTFIKPEFNKQHNRYRVENAVNVIQQSDVICVYGMSLGESDLMWVNLLIEWLKADSNHKLFFFQHSSETYNTWERDVMMDVEEERKELFLKRITNSTVIDEQMLDQIHIPIAYDIFNFNEYLSDKKESNN